MWDTPATEARPLPRRRSAVVLSRPLWGDSSTYSYASTTKLISFMSPEKPLPDSTKVPQCCATTPASLSTLAINSCFFHLIKRPVVLLQCKAFRGGLGNSFLKEKKIFYLKTDILTAGINLGCTTFYTLTMYPNLASLFYNQI